MGNGQRRSAREFWSLVVLLLASFVAEPARAFCRLEPLRKWASGDGIPVYLNTHLTDYICKGDCQSFDDLRRTTQIALARYFDQSGSWVRFAYAGDTDRNFNDQISGAIHITLRPKGCSGENARTDCKWTDAGLMKSCRIELCADHDWVSYFDTTGTFDDPSSFQGVLMHELMHTLGFDHPEECKEVVASVVSTGINSHHSNDLFEADAVALRELYGGRSQAAWLYRSNDGLSWQLGPSTPLTMSAGALHSPSGCGGGNSQPLLVAYPTRLSSRAVQISRFNGAQWTTPIDLPGATSPYPVGVACASATDQVVAWNGQYDNRSGRSQVIASRSTDAGASWTDEEITDIVTPGMGLAWDPASRTYISVLRAGGSQTLLSKVLPDSPINFHILGNLSMTSAEAPSLACGDPEIVGEKNCLLTWVSTNWDRFLWYAFGRVVDSKEGRVFHFDATSLYAAPIVMFGTPSVAYVPDRGAPWHLVFQQGTTVVQALTHSASHAAIWKPDPPVQFGPQNVSALTSPQAASMAAGKGQERFALFLSGFSRSK